MYRRRRRSRKSFRRGRKTSRRRRSRLSGIRIGYRM